MVIVEPFLIFMKRNLLTETPTVTTDKESALKSAMERLGGYILWYLEDCCGDHQEAENLFQQLWVSVFESLPPEKYDHLPLVRRRAYQLYVDHVRRRSVRSFVTYAEELPEPDPTGLYTEPASDLEESALRERFWEMFPGVEIDPVDQEAFWLFHREGYSVEEIAQKLNMAGSTVHDRIKRVRARCREYMEMEDQS